MKRIIDDWKQNWGFNISTIGLFIMIGLVSYHAGTINGKIELCGQDNATLVEDISGRVYCEYNYIAPVNDWEKWQTEDWVKNDIQPITIQ